MRIRKPNKRPIPSGLSEDYLIYSGKGAWAASKNASYRKSVSELVSSLHEFLSKHCLYARAKDPPLSVPEFELRRKELTEEGFEFLWVYVNGYFEHLDRTMRAANREYLDACWRDYEIRKRKSNGET